ncbi:MAG TPA: hypothetical protein VD927_13590 [Chryseosolibacter sp.]|nr:hypothetical protein [Chryseosolibacter sp.]
MKKFSTIVLVASAMILLSFTVTSSASEQEVKIEETHELLFEPRGGYALEDSKI